MNDETAPAATPETPTPIEPRRFSPRPILIGTGAALAVLTLGIGGFALADTFRGDDRIVITSNPTGSPTDLPSPTPSPSQSDDNGQIDPADRLAVEGAALQAVGGGTVTEVKRGDSPGDAAWKVEITLANGDEAEVRLDANLNVIRVDLDNDVSGDDNGDDDNSGSDDSGSDDSGHGSDDSGSDDSGSGSDDD